LELLSNKKGSPKPFPTKELEPYPPRIKMELEERISLIPKERTPSFLKEKIIPRVC